MPLDGVHILTQPSFNVQSAGHNRNLFTAHLFTTGSAKLYFKQDLGSSFGLPIRKAGSRCVVDLSVVTSGRNEINNYQVKAGVRSRS